MRVRLCVCVCVSYSLASTQAHESISIDLWYKAGLTVSTLTPATLTFATSLAGHPKPPPIYEVVYPFDAHHRGVLTTKPGDIIKVESTPTKGLKWTSGHLTGKTDCFIYRLFVNGEQKNQIPHLGIPHLRSPIWNSPSENIPSGNPPSGNPIGYKVTFMDIPHLDILYLAKEKPAGEDLIRIMIGVK